MRSIDRDASPMMEPARSEHLAGLLERCAEHHEDAFEELYRLSSRQLYGVLLRILRMESIAEEALQETFVKVWQRAGSYRAEAGKPMAWMSGIARHHAIDVLRRRGRSEFHESTDRINLIDSTPDAAKPLHEMSSDAQSLLICLEKLPEAARDCIVKAFCEGYSHEELSEAKDAPLGTVKSWIRRGLVSLRKCVDEHA